MALKAMLLCLLASFLLFTISHSETPAKPPHHAPVPEYPHHPPPAHAPIKAHPPHHHVPPMAPTPPHVGNGCTPKCEARCETHRKKRPCMKVCTTCCKKCQYCVPPGTSGNEEKCKNWDQVTIHGEIYKCP